MGFEWNSWSLQYQNLKKHAVLYQLSHGEPPHWEQVSLLSSSLPLKGMKQ